MSLEEKLEDTEKLLGKFKRKTNGQQEVSERIAQLIEVARNHNTEHYAIGVLNYCRRIMNDILNK